MFLYSTPSAARQPEPANPVIDAIRRASERTGTDFGYLLATAQRESALDPSAKAPTSSATGLFQFIEQTWLGLMKTEGPKLGLSDLAGAISPRSEGGHGVADPSARAAILRLREDPALASVMAGALTQQNREALAGAIGREPTAGELYMAHLLGARGATELIRAASDDPGRAVAQDMPEAAAANRAIFYGRGGRPRSAAELYGLLSATPAGAAQNPAAPPPPPAAAPGPPARPDGPALHSLFRTEGRTGPVSDAVAKLWRVNRANAASGQSPISFFPRADGSYASLGPEDEAGGEPALPVRAAPESIAAPLPFAPLPPPRPRGLPTAGLRPS